MFPLPRRRRLVLLSAAACAAPLLAHAQTSETVSPLVVAASRLASSADASPYSTQVASEARLGQAQDLPDALAGLADVHVQTPGGRSGFASLYVRGADPNFTALMFDGVPLNAPTNSRGGAANLSELSVRGLERLELVMGPLSGLYGSGALAGGLNLVVAGGAPAPEFQAAISGGSRSDYDMFGQWRGPLGQASGGSVSIEALDDGHGPAGSRFRARSAVGKFAALDDPDAGHLTLRLASSDARTFPDNSGGPRLASLRDLESRKAEEQLAGIERRLARGGWGSLTLTASVLNRRDRVESPGVAPSAFDPFGVPAGSDRIRYQRGDAALLLRRDSGPWRALAGLEAQTEKGRDRGVLMFGPFAAPSDFDLDRTTYSSFLEGEGRLAALTVNAGARLDKIDGIGPRATLRAGGRLSLAPSLTLRAAAGTGFKAPSFYALGNPFVGNPALRPEQSRSGELGLVWTPTPNLKAGLTLFSARYKGLIDFVPTPFPHLENRNQVRSEGATLVIDLAPTPRLTGQIQADYVDTRDEATDARLLGRPRTRLASTWRWRSSDRLSLDARWSLVGDRKDYSTPTGPVTLKRYSTLDVGGEWRLGGTAMLRLDLDNLLDDHHEEAIGFPSPGRHGRLTLSRSF